MENKLFGLYTYIYPSWIFSLYDFKAEIFTFSVYMPFILDNYSLSIPLSPVSPCRSLSLPFSPFLSLSLPLSHSFSLSLVFPPYSFSLPLCLSPSIFLSLSLCLFPFLSFDQPNILWREETRGVASFFFIRDIHRHFLTFPQGPVFVAKDLKYNTCNSSVTRFIW